MKDSMESARARSHRNYQRLKNQHRCVQCAEKLPEGQEFIRCLKCRESQKGEGVPQRYLDRIDRFHVDLDRVIQTAATMSVQEQADNLGLDVDRVYALRARARKDGVALPLAKGGAPKGNDYHHESPRWRELERSHGRCGVCGLLEPHECLDSYSGLATSRPGPREAGLYTMKHPRGQ